MFLNIIAITFRFVWFKSVKFFMPHIIGYPFYGESSIDYERWRYSRLYITRSFQHSYDHPVTVEPPDPRQGLTDDRISRFAAFRADQKSVDDGCAICIDGVETNKMMIRLDCSHFYCNACIRKWFEKSKSCPLCRKEFENWLWIVDARVVAHSFDWPLTK